MGNMYLMCGLSGSGKTTFAKVFAKENNLFYLGIDEFYEWYNGDDSIRENIFEIWIEFFQAIHRAEQEGKDVLIDTNAPTYVDRVQILDWFPGFNEYHLVWINSTEELRFANNRMRRRKIPDDVMHSMYHKFQPPLNKNEDQRWNSIRKITNNYNSFYTFEWEREPNREEINNALKEFFTNED